MTEQTFVGYAGTINRNGGNNFFNISNLSNDEVTIVISDNGGTGDLLLENGDSNTTVSIYDSNGVLISSNLVSLVEFGQTGPMADSASYPSGHPYTIITIDGDDYMFLEDVADPTAVAINPFQPGNSNPLDGDPNTTDPHEVCFVDGTSIRTPDGDRLVEELTVGDLVVTRDNGVQKIIWTGAREMSGLRADKTPPVRISANAFGEGLPVRDLLVSPQHRILVSDWRAELLFGESEVLVAAKHLVNDSTIRFDKDLSTFSYHHILFEKHETVFSEGLPTESFHPGDMAIAALDDDAKEELFDLFPELENSKAPQSEMTHMSLKSYEVAALRL